jgi:WD40 repeat protein
VNDYLCSVSFCEDNKVSIGNTLGQIKVFDIVKKKKLNQFDGHTGRVGSLSWSSGMLASGSRDGTVATWDLRDGLVTQYRAHSQ